MTKDELWNELVRRKGVDCEELLHDNMLLALELLVDWCDKLNCEMNELVLAAMSVRGEFPDAKRILEKM